MIREELIEAAARAIANDIAGQEDPRFKVPDVWDLTLPWLDQGTVDFRLTATAVIDLIAPEIAQIEAENARLQDGVVTALADLNNGEPALARRVLEHTITTEPGHPTTAR